MLTKATIISQSRVIRVLTELSATGEGVFRSFSGNVQEGFPDVGNA